MHAEGVIAPLTSAAAVDLHITVDDVPINEETLRALGPKRQKILEALMSREKYQKLLERGLVRVPGGDGGGGGDGVGGPFALGGIGSVVIDVQRALGEEPHYTEQVRVRVPEAGVLHEWFPLPIIARNVELLVADNEVNIIAGEFEGIHGGRVGVDLFVDLTMPGESGLHLTITADDVPTDELLLAALPGGLDDPAQESPEGYSGIRSSSAVLEQLGITGAIDCVVVIESRESGELGYDIDVAIDGLSASPKHGPDVDAVAVELEQMAGRLRVSERELGLTVTSQVRARGGVAGETLTPQAQGTLSIDATMGLGTANQKFTAEVVADVPDITLALEDLLTVIAPELAARITKIRTAYQPDGGVRALVHAAGDASGDGELSRLDIEVIGSEGLAFETDAGRLTVTSSAGTLAFSALAPESVEFDDWVAQVRLDDAQACGVALSGRSPFGRPWAAGDFLKLGLRGAKLETPLVWDGAKRTLPPKLAQAMETSEIKGIFDADLVLRGNRVSTQPRVTGEIRPTQAELTIAGQRVTMESMRGAIVLDETGGTFDAFRAQGDGWWAEIGGTWIEAGSGSIFFQSTLNAESEFGLVPEVRALLPAGLRGALEAVSIESAGLLTAEGVEFRVSLDDDEDSAYTTSGRVEFAGASIDFGVKVTDASGYLDFQGQSEPGEANGNFGIGVILDSAQAAGIHVQDGMLRITSDPLSGALLVPVILADAYGGRVSGSAVVQAGAGAGGMSVYDAEFRLAGVPLGELLADWDHMAGVERADQNEEGAPDRPDAKARGLVDAGLTLTGVVGEQGSRRGRGRILVGGDRRAEVLSLPLLLPLIKVSNLQVPVHDPLDFGEAVFYLDGDRVVFERVGVFARSVDIFGYGEMTLPGFDLDLRFTSRAAERLPVVSAVLEKFRDELVTTQVRGTVNKPEVSLEQFAKTRRMFARVVGQEQSERERRMLEIERLSRESQQREWRLPRRDGSSPIRGQ